MADTASRGRRQSKTLLLTDIQGSTRMWEHDPEAMGTAVARHDEIVRAATEVAGGQLVKSKGEGDSTFSVFDDAGAALHAAVSLQRALAAEAWLTSEPLRVRVGIHTGEVELREGDFYGRTVNRASRIRELATGASIVLSAATVAASDDHVPSGTDLVDLGAHQLRGLVGAEHVYALAHPDLPDPDLLLASLRRRATPPVPAALRVHGGAEMVGRDRELAELGEAWSATGAQRPVFALIGGEPGVGKTRLAAALAEHAAASGALVLFGRCDEEPLRPYQPFAEALGCALDRLSDSEVVDAAGDVAPELVLLRPELRTRIAVLGEATGERFALFDAIASFLARISIAWPTLIVLDDLHWADEPSLALLRHTLQVNGASSTMVVATYRDTDIAADCPLVQSLVSVRREVPTVELALRGLDRADVATLLGAAHQDALDDVWAVSDGNPFFVVELVRELGRSSPSGVPQSVRQSVIDRVERLPAEARDFLRAAAITGVDVDVAVAAAAAGVEVDAARPTVVRGVLLELPEAPHRLRFAHGLVREAVLDAMTSVSRAALHRRVAVAIETLHGDRLDQHGARLAYHYREAGELAAQGPAFAWSMRAGRYAGNLLAYEEAESHFRDAARIADGDSDVGGRITADLELAEVLRRSGRPATGQALAESAAATASEVGSSDLAAWAVFTTRFGQALGVPGNLDTIRIARSNLQADSAWKGPLDVAYAGELLQALDVDAGIELLTAVRDRARLAGDGVLLGLALTGSHMFVDRLAAVDEILAALASADEATAPSVRLSPRVLRVQTESLRIGQLVAAGDVAAARQAAIDFTQRYGDETGTLESNVPLFAMSDALLSGDWLGWQRRVADFRGDPELASAYAAQLLAGEMIAAWLRGSLAELASGIEALPSSLMFVRPGLAIALAHSERFDDASRVVAECAANDGFARRGRTVSGRVELVLLGYAVAHIGDIGAARAIYETLLPRRGQIAAWAGWAFWGAFDAVLGALAASRGQAAEAVSHLEAARELHDRAGWRALSAITTADLVAALLDRGSPGDAGTAAPAWRARPT